MFGKFFGRKLSCVVVLLFALAGSSLSVAQTEQQIKAVVDHFSKLSRTFYPELLKQIQKTGQYRYSIVLRDGTSTQGVVTALGNQGILVIAEVPTASRGQNGQMKEYNSVMSMSDNNGDGVLDQMSSPGGPTVYSPRDVGSLTVWAAQMDGIYKQLGN